MSKHKAHFCHYCNRYRASGEICNVCRGPLDKAKTITITVPEK
jgi:hypothetical protein